MPAGGPLRATLFRPFGAEGRAVGSLGRRRAGLPGPAGSRDRRGLRSGGRTREAAVTADGEVAARRGTSGCPLGLSRRRRKMAEASAAGTDAGATVAAHRFFCHFCKGEVSPKLPVRAPCPLGYGIRIDSWPLRYRNRVLSFSLTHDPLTPVSLILAIRCLRSLAPSLRRQGPGSITASQPYFLDGSTCLSFALHLFVFFF